MPPKHRLQHPTPQASPKPSAAGPKRTEVRIWGVSSEVPRLVRRHGVGSKWQCPPHNPLHAGCQLFGQRPATTDTTHTHQEGHEDGRKKRKTTAKRERPRGGRPFPCGHTKGDGHQVRRLCGRTGCSLDGAGQRRPPATPPAAQHEPGIVTEYVFLTEGPSMAPRGSTIGIAHRRESTIRARWGLSRPYRRGPAMGSLDGGDPREARSGASQLTKMLLRRPVRRSHWLFTLSTFGPLSGTSFRGFCAVAGGGGGPRKGL